MTDQPDRLPSIAREQMTPEQQSAADELVRGRRGALFGPFIPLLRSPELLTRAQRLGEYLRYDSALPARLRELAILVTARQYRQAFEWHVHAPTAVEAGLSATVVAEIAACRGPQFLEEDEAAVYDFCTELHTTHQVSDETYSQALALLGERGVVDLCGVCGYYGLLALVMNAARTPLPQGAAPPW